LTPGDPPPPSRLRPLGFADLLDRSFRIYRRHFLLLFGLALLVSIPALVPELLGGSFTQVGAILASPTTPPTDLHTPFWPTLARIVLLVVMVPFSVGVIAAASLPSAMGEAEAPPLVSIVGTILRRYLALLGLVGLTVLIALSLVCMPLGIWLLVRISLAVPALLAERVGPIRAIRRSWQLTHVAWWRCFGVIVVVAIVADVLAGVLGFAAGISVQFLPLLPSALTGLILVLTVTLISVVTVPLLWVGLVVLYVDARVRKDSLDMDLLAAAALAPSSEGAA
jgi:hypothetical protein